MVAVAIFGRVDRASANSTADMFAADKSTAAVFPQSIEVIPGKLKVKVFLHEVKY